MKGQMSGKYLWMMALGCLLYGAGFLFLFSQTDSFWGKLVSGFLGVGAITLLPVFYGFCWRQYLRAGYGARTAAEENIFFSFGVAGIFTVFSLPVCCLFMGSGAELFFTYTLFISLLFHGALWYAFFI